MWDKSTAQDKKWRPFYFMEMWITSRQARLRTLKDSVFLHITNAIQMQYVPPLHVENEE